VCIASGYVARVVPVVTCACKALLRISTNLSEKDVIAH
jgi:hypothetical protein